MKHPVWRSGSMKMLYWSDLSSLKELFFLFLQINYKNTFVIEKSLIINYSLLGWLFFFYHQLVNNNVNTSYIPVFMFEQGNNLWGV